MLRIFPVLTAALLLLPATGAVAFTISDSPAFLIDGRACAGESRQSNCQFFNGTGDVLIPPSDEGAGTFSDSSASASATAAMTASLLFSSASLSFDASATASAEASGEAIASVSIGIHPLVPFGVEVVLDPGEALAIVASGAGDGEWLLSIGGAGVECGTLGGPCPLLVENTGLTSWLLGVSFEYELRAGAGFGLESDSKSGSATVTLSLVPEPDLILVVTSSMAATIMGFRRKMSRHFKARPAATSSRPA